MLKHFRPEGARGDIPYGEYVLRAIPSCVSDTITACPGHRDMLMIERTTTNKFIDMEKGKDEKFISPRLVRAAEENMAVNEYDVDTNCATVGEFVEALVQHSARSKEFGTIKMPFGEVKYDSGEVEQSLLTTPGSEWYDTPIAGVRAAGAQGMMDYTIQTVTSEVDDSRDSRGADGYNFRIRKLTPRECFRLMDVDDKYIDKIQGATAANGKPLISKTQQYKMAGNSIVVACLHHLFENMLYPPEGTRQLTIFDL